MSVLTLTGYICLSVFDSVCLSMVVLIVSVSPSFWRFPPSLFHNRWYQLGLKVPKTEKKSRNKKRKELKLSAAERGSDDEDSSDDEDEEEEDDDDEDEELLNMRRIERENENSFGYIDDDGCVLSYSVCLSLLSLSVTRYHLITAGWVFFCLFVGV